MLKFLLIGLALFALYKLITNDRGKKNQDETKVKERKIATGEMVKDPICGTYVERDGSVTVRDGKKLHCFCSYECRQKFLDGLEDSGRVIPEKTNGE